MIVDAGIKVGATHLGKVQKFVQGRLEAIENELKDEKLRALDAIKTEAATIKAEADEQMNALRSQLEDQTSTSHRRERPSTRRIDGIAPIHLPG